MPSVKVLFGLFAKICFTITFLVILAGSVVRTTQSGMGCPDWPRCFGYYIPPVDPSRLDFHPGEPYNKGMMIIRNDTLWRAVEDFTAGDFFSRVNWEKYPKHNYARFVVAHTWIEYINRLLGALMGLFVLVLFICSFAWLKQKPLLTVLSGGMLLLTGFQGWLGALVVSSNLAPVKITVHMLAALALLIIIQLILHKSLIHKMANRAVREYNLRRLVLLALVLTVSQIILGTSVREAVDSIAAREAYTGREGWIGQLPSVFLFHRSFSILILIFNGWILYRAISSSNSRALKFVVLTCALLLLEVLAGILLNYADFPAWVQPLHLLLSMLVFSAQFEAWLSLRSTRRIKELSKGISA
jgi:cytochrome c oxidase assembly protein subunit 15